MQPIVAGNQGVKMSIGTRICDLRKQNNISQGQLASMMDVSRQAVSKWENDSSTPDALKLIKLADIFNVDIEYLATGSNRNQKHEETPMKLPKEPLQSTSSAPSPLPLILFCLFFFFFGLIIALSFITKDD